MSIDLTPENTTGTWTALVTPFGADPDELDLRSLENLIDFQLKAGVSGFVACGSTGEAQCLTDEEYRTVIEHTLSYVGGRVPVLGGIGVSSTRRAAEIGKYLSEAGADGALLVTPPYVKPMQHGIVAHFAAVSASSKLPIVAYNIPGRAACSILPETVEKLAEKKLIIAIKDSSGSAEYAAEVSKRVGGVISHLSGEDSLTHAIMEGGGRGVISAAGNLIPAEFAALTSAALKKNFAESKKIQEKILPVINTLYIETNPIPVKFALAKKGILAHDHVRLPLTAPAESTRKAIEAILG